MIPPKVFISHATEDKERFVLSFAKKLRTSGIDAWLDRWEMLPGDSLVDKIFGEGLRNASAIIVVLSTNSVSKGWVREEINAAFVKRINDGSKLIPIVLDNCVVPDGLLSTVWERIDNIEAYDENFNRIVASITGVHDKPSLGSLPSYVASPIRNISGLTRIDTLVLKSACELAMANGHNHIDGPALQSAAALFQLPEQELEDSLEILEKQNCVEIARILSRNVPSFTISTYGFQQYATVYVDNYDDKITDVAYAIVNHQLKDNQSIAKHLNFNQFLVDHVLDILELKDYITLSKHIGGHAWIVDVSASLKRDLG